VKDFLCFLNTVLNLVPVEGVFTPAWREKVFEEVEGEYRVNRRYYELCVLEKLQRALKCKEVWVEGSYAFRNPSEDMPGDWSDEQRRILHYQELGKPLGAQAFVRSLKERLITALAHLNRVLPQLGHLRIFHHNKKDERGLWALAKLEAQVEPRRLGLIKEAIGKRYGILDLLDVFVEVDRTSTLHAFSRILARRKSARGTSCGHSPAWS
jgi:hypothetical protein